MRNETLMVLLKAVPRKFPVNASFQLIQATHAALQKHEQNMNEKQPNRVIYLTVLWLL